MIPSASGDSPKQIGLMNHVVTTSPNAAPITNPQASSTPMAPDGRCRAAVRGFRASNRRSAIRLNPIAAVRAQTMAARVKMKIRQPGQPPPSRDATAMLASANGNAKTVCEKRTNAKYFRTETIGNLLTRLFYEQYTQITSVHQKHY